MQRYEPDPGVYFDMPMADYLRIPYLSCSLLRDMQVSPLDAWENHINPERKEVERSYFDFGTAVHSVILEGWDAFNATVAQRFVPEPGAVELRTVDDLKKRCAVLGVPKAGVKSDLINRLIATGAHTHNDFYDVQKEMHDKANAGKIELTPDQLDAVARIYDLAMNYAQLRPSILSPEGKPEATIIWYDREFGVMCKARPDYLNAGSIVSLKTFSHRSRRQVESAIPDVISRENYFLDAAFYLRAWDAYCELKNLHQPGKYIFLFVRSGLVNNIITREFSRLEGKHSQTAQFQIGQQSMYDAVTLYKQYMGKFGHENPWQAVCKARPLDDSDFPAWVMN